MATNFADISNTLVALNLDGSEKWRRGVGRIDYRMMIGSDGTAYFVNSLGLNVVNPDGSDKWLYPIVGDGGLLAILSDGTIVCQEYLDPSETIIQIKPDGTRTVIMDHQFQLAQPVIGADGTIYVGCDPDGML
jgi:outer membrane protein assembly factor BamB